jgi:membrane protein implicated in regulation of membrane protease activity
MIKNNLRAMFIHLGISLVAIAVSMSFGTSTAKWVSEEAARAHKMQIIFMSLVVLGIALFLYYYFAKKFLSRHEDRLKNILSVSSPALIGILFWIILAISHGLGDGFLNNESWFVYGLYNGYGLWSVWNLGLSSPLLLLLLSVLPSIFMTAGISAKE